MVQKTNTNTIQNHNKKHREILQEKLSLYMSMIFSSCSSLRNFGPSRQILISWLILFSLRDACKGETRRFMTQKLYLTNEVDGGLSNANLKSLSKW